MQGIKTGEKDYLVVGNAWVGEMSTVDHAVSYLIGIVYKFHKWQAVIKPLIDD